MVESVDAATVLAEALSKDLITDRQRSECSGESDPYKKADKFLGYLHRSINRNCENFRTFLEILDRTGQKGIAERLRGNLLLQIINYYQSRITSSNFFTGDLAEVARSLQPDEPTEGQFYYFFYMQCLFYTRPVMTEQFNKKYFEICSRGTA